MQSYPRVWAQFFSRRYKQDDCNDHLVGDLYFLFESCVDRIDSNRPCLMVSGVASETRDANMTWTDISKTDTVMTRRYPLSMVDAV